MKIENGIVKGRKNIYVSIDEIIEKFELDNESILSFYLNISDDLCFQCLDKEYKND